MASDGGHPRLLVADGDAAFADAAAGAIRETNPEVDVETVATDEAAIRRATGGRTLCGVVVGSMLQEPIDLIGRLDERTDLPVVYVTDEITDRDAVADAVRAGADDYFPRTTASAQYAVVVDVVLNRFRADDHATDTSAGTRAAAPPDRHLERAEPFDRASRTVFENVSDGLILHDPATGEILDVNEQFCKMNGYGREELVGEDAGVVTPPGAEHSYAVAREKIRAAREEGPQLFEWRNQRENGETFPVEVHLSVVRLGGDERVLASVRDISERRQREREFEQIFNAVQDAIGVFDPESLDILDANDAYLDMLGYDDLATFRAAGVEGLSVLEEGYTLERGREIHQRVAESGDPEVVEWRGETKDGERRWLEVKVAPATVRGESVTISISRDVTEQRERERRLQKSKRRLRLIAEHIDEITYLASGDFSEILYLNPAYEQIYGRSVEEAYADPQSFIEAAHPEDRDRYEADIRTVVEDIEAGEPKDAYEGEYRIERDGDVRWVSAVRFPIENERGVVDRVVGRVQDITKRKRREREYEQVFNGVNDGITIHDPDTGEIVDANEAYLAIFGYDDLETVQKLGIGGLSATEEGYTEDRGRAVISGVAASGEPTTVEWRVETSRGDRRWLEATVAPAVIGGEKRVLGIHRDVTERKRREREYEQIFNGVTDVIGVYHPETAELLDVNETMCDLLGYDRETILAADPTAITATELGFDAETIKRVVREVATTDEPILDLEWALRTASGDALWIEVNATPAEINGQRRVLTLARDVTGRRDRDERVAVLNRVLRHNLRNGIDVIRAYANGITDVVDHDRATEYTDRILRAADGLLELSEKARTAERILRNDENQEVQAAGTVIDSVVSDVRSRDTRATLDVTHAASDALVETDIFRLVMTELIENAAEHGGDAPSITVSTARDDDGTTVTVTDDGPGIPDRVLTPFRPGSETQQRHNHGLGLWLVSWGVRRLGGGIEFERPPNGGTTVRVRLPDLGGRRSGTSER